MSRLSKAMGAARAAKSHRDDVLKAEPQEEAPDLFKGAHDAMYHHACHARAAEEASWGGPDPKKNEEVRGHASKHAHAMLKHALDNAKGRSGSSMKYAMQKSADYFGDEAYGSDKDAHSKKVKHFKDGGGFIPHKSDKD